MSKLEADYFSGARLRFVYHGIIYSKKNSKQIIRNSRTGRPMLISSKQAQKMERDIVTQLSEQNARKPLKTPLDCECRVSITIYQPDRRRRDLDNQATSLLDGLVDAAILLDDKNSIVTEIHVKNGGVDKSDPRAEIEVEYGTLL